MYIAQAGSTHEPVIQPSEYWDCRCEPPCLALFIVLNLCIPAFFLTARPLFIPAVSSNRLLTAHGSPMLVLIL